MTAIVVPRRPPLAHAGIPAIPAVPAARTAVAAAPASRPAAGPTEEMVDVARLLSPAALRQVDPRVRAFYRDPLAHDLRVAAEFPDAASRWWLGTFAAALAGQGHLTTTEGPAVATLYRDAAGRTHWDRYAVVDGRREPLFIARFEIAGRQIKETFRVRGIEVPLYFDVAPYQGGLRLTLDHRRSSWLAALADITFVTLPAPDGVVSTGTFTVRGGLLRAVARFRMPRRA